MNGQAVTISEVIRGYLAEQICLDAGRDKRENAAVAALRDEIVELREEYRLLVQDVQKLDKKFSALFEQLATREQVESLTEGIAVMINRLQGR